jgi:hypothetical protein
MKGTVKLWHLLHSLFNMVLLMGTRVRYRTIGDLYHDDDENGCDCETTLLDHHPKFPLEPSQ